MLCQMPELVLARTIYGIGWFLLHMLDNLGIEIRTDRRFLKKISEITTNCDVLMKSSCVNVLFC